MAPKNTFSLKFTSDGLSDVLKASEKVRLSYEDWIESAEKSIKEANKLAEEYAGNQEKLAEAEELKARAAKTATRAVAQSYRELGVTSTKSIEDQKQRAISAFEAIKRSGVASAEDIDRAQKSLQERLKRLDGQLDSSSAGLRELGQEADRAGGEFTILKGAIAGTIANLASGLITKGIDSMVGLGRSAIATRTEFSKLRDQIALLEGGEEQGKTVFDRLQQFNTTTPFELREVTQAYITLANRGVKPTNDQLESLGDLALAQNKPLQQVIEAVADVSNSERFREFGINSKRVGENVELTFKGVTKTVKATEEEVLRAVVAFGNLEGISGNIAKASGRLDGVGSNIADSMAGIQDTIGGIFEPLLVSGGKFLVEVIQPLSNPANWTPLTEAFRVLASAFAELIPGVQTVEGAVAGGLKFAVTSVAEILRTWAAFITENKTQLIGLGAAIYQSAGAALQSLVNSAREFTQNLRENPQLINEFLARVGDAAIALGALAQLAIKIGSIVAGIALSFGAANEATNGWLGNIAIAAAGVLGIVKAVAAVTAAVSSIGAAFVAVGPVVTGIIGIVTGIGSVIGGVLTVALTGIASVVAAVGAVPIAIGAAIVAAGVLIYTFRDEILGLLQALWEAVKNAAILTWQTIVAEWSTTFGLIQAELQLLTQWWEKIKETAANAWEFVKSKALESFDLIKGGLDNILKPFSEIRRIGGDIANTILSWGDPIKKAQSALDKFKNGFINILGLGKDVGTDVGEKLETKTTGTGGPLLPAGEGAFHPSNFAITSPFGMRDGRLHAGTDFGTPQGTKLGNIFGSGTITIADSNVGGYGGLIELTLDNGDVYRFGHMSQIMVRPGQRVPPGALLGLTGGEPGTFGAGRSTGPHLHLEHYPGGGAPVPFTGGRGGPNAAETRAPAANNIARFNRHICGPGCKIHNKKTRGKGGPKTKAPEKKKDEPKILKVNVGGTQTEVELLQKDGTQRIDVKAEIKSARETLDKALSQLGLKKEDDSAKAEREIRESFKKIVEDLDAAKEKYELIIAVKQKLNQKTEEEKKALDEIEAARKSANTQMEFEVKKTTELIKIRGELTRAENDRTLGGLESEIEGRRIAQGVRSGQLSAFDADRLKIQRRITEQNAEFSSQIARLKLDRAEAETDDDRIYIDQLIDKYTELNNLSLQDLVNELNDVDRAQQEAAREAARVLPTSEEIAANITGTLREIPGLITEVLKGAQSFGGAVLSLIGSLAERLSGLFLDKGFNALEGIIGGLLGGGQKQKSGGGNLLGSLFQAGISAAIGGAGGGGATSALLPGASPIFAARGGLIRGRGSSMSDSIPARLSNNEYVVSAGSVRAVGSQALDYLNATGSFPTSGNRENTVVFNISTPDAGGFAKTERQLHSAAVAELQRFR